MKNVGNKLIESMKEAIAYGRGKKGKAITHKISVPEKIDVKAIRLKLHLSRTQFATRYGFSPHTLQHWEQGDRKPHGAARILLAVLAKNPNAVEKALISYSGEGV